MEKIDYKELGLISGVEIHQQLLTKNKLFCHCPAGHYTTKYDAKILRHMRPTLSELGEYDGTALMEFKTKKEIIYQLNKVNVCTYEMDDTPPFLVNEEGLDIAIEIALMLNCQIVDEMHIARKQYLDGSIPTGFQRTAIVGVEGVIPYNDREIKIIQLGFEEDSCREVSDIGHTITYNTDRLGIPLIEAVTYPDMKTPQEVADVIRILGRILRVTQKVRRGIGSVRQDVNVSIRGGTRVEIKGVPQIGWVPSLVHNEAIRQRQLLRIKDVLHSKRIVDNESLETVDKDITNSLRSCKLDVLRTALDNGHAIRGIKLCGLKDIILYPTQPNLTFTNELMGRVRVIACLDNLPILLTTENWPMYQDREKDLKKIRNEFAMGSDDVVVVCWGPKEDTITGTNEIRIRVEDAIKGVPNETRQPSKYGTTDFERILPGPDRMYPDTDHPPTTITKERVEKIRLQLVEHPWIREERYLKYGVPKESAQELAISKKALLFDRIEKELDVDMKLVGIVLTQVLKSVRRKGFDVDKLSDDTLFNLFAEYQKGTFTKDFIPIAIKELSKDLNKDITNVVSQYGIKKADEQSIQEIINASLKNTWKRNRNKVDKSYKVSYYMGFAMRNLIGKADGKAINELVAKRLS